MKNHSLISVTKLCEAGCNVTFGKTECIVSQNGKEIIRGTKNAVNGLWYIPISNNGKSFAIQDCEQQLNIAYHTSTMPETIKLIHQFLKFANDGHIV